VFLWSITIEKAGDGKVLSTAEEAVR